MELVPRVDVPPEGDGCRCDGATGPASWLPVLLAVFLGARRLGRRRA